MEFLCLFRWWFWKRCESADERISDAGESMKADKERSDAHGSRSRRRISVGAIIVATIAMVLRAQGDTNFKQRPVYAKPTEVYVPGI